MTKKGKLQSNASIKSFIISRIECKETCDTYFFITKKKIKSCFLNTEQSPKVSAYVYLKKNSGVGGGGGGGG